LNQDLQIACRNLLRRPAHAALVVVMLGLGIGGNTAMFSLVDSLLLSPLPFDEPERLVWLDETAPEWGLESVSIDYADFHAWSQNNKSFDSLALIKELAYNLVGGEAVERIEAAGVTHDLDRVLRAGPVLGRMFTPEEDAPGGPPVTILSDGLWKRLFAGDAAAIGQTLRLDGKPHEIVGVLPPHIGLPFEAQLWVPIADEPEKAGSYQYSGIGRLAPGATLASAKLDLDRTLEPLIEKHPFKKAVSSVVTPFRAQLVGQAGSTAWALLAAVALVLVVACVNVAALQLARGTAREKEMGIRAALGARRGRLVRQLLTEGLVLSAAGGALGLALGVWGLRTLGAMAAEDLPFWVSFAPRTEALLLCLAVGVGTTLVFGLLPAFLTSGVNVVESMRSGGGASASRSRRRSLSGLVVGEMALAQVLLVGAGLVVLSQRELLRVDPGYRAEDVLSFGVALPEASYPEDADRLALYRELRRQLGALPGVTSVAISTKLPFQGHDGYFFEAEGAGDADDGARREVTLLRQTSDGYAATMGIELLRGRELGAAATSAGELLEVLVNERFAQLYWPGEDPLGRRIRAGEHQPWLRVVGVSRSVKHYGLAEPARPGVYVPLANNSSSRVSFVLRTAVEPTSLIPSARRVVRGLDAELPLYQVATLEEELSRSLTLRRLTSWLFAVFAIVALTLAAGGTFGVVSYLMQRRTSEIGLRIALGATTRSVLALVLRQGTALAALGAALGLLAGLFAGRLLERLLFQIDTRDPRVFVSVAAMLLGIALIANLLPAIRASRVQPMQALRED